MNDFKDIARKAFALLERHPEDAGITVNLSGRLHVYIDPSDGGFSVVLHRVGFAMLATQMPPFDVLGGFRASNMTDAAEQLAKLLDEHATAGATVERMLYRNDAFARGSFSANRQARESFARLKKLRGTADDELRKFVGATVKNALSWGGPNFTPSSVSLWFYPGEDISAIYVTITSTGGCAYSVETEDRVSWPWDESSTRLVGKEEIGEFVAGYLSKRHAYEFSGLKVYLAYSIAG